MIGMDPAKVLGGEFPLLDLNYLQGSREAALTRMKQGHACIVPEHFLRETGLNIGDQFEVVPPENPNPKQPAVYTIARLGTIARGGTGLPKPPGYESVPTVRHSDDHRRLRFGGSRFPARKTFACLAEV